MANCFYEISTYIISLICLRIICTAVILVLHNGSLNTLVLCKNVYCAVSFWNERTFWRAFALGIDQQVDVRIRLFLGQCNPCFVVSHPRARHSTALAVRATSWCNEWANMDIICFLAHPINISRTVSYCRAKILSCMPAFLQQHKCYPRSNTEQRLVE